MADEKPINSKPFSSATLMPIQKGLSVSDINSLKVNSLSQTSGDFVINQQTVASSSGLLSISNNRIDSGTLQHSVATAKLTDITNGVLIPNDSVETSDSSDTSTESQLIQYLSNLEPNILNNYSQATYHLKVFLANADVIKNPEKSIDQLVKDQPDIFSDDNIIIIAESGVNAGIFIDSFSMTNVVTIDPQYNTSGVSATMVLKEPLGANFIDYYNDAIDQLGYETRIQAPVFIQVSFRGYDENGNYMVEDDIGTKMYRMMMRNITGQFLGTGAEYTIELVILSDIARQIANSNIVDNLTVQGKTVQDFYDKIIDEWNKYQRNVESDETLPPAQTTGTSAAAPSGDKDAANLTSTENKEKPTPSEKNKFKYLVQDSCVEYKDCLTWEVGKASNRDRHRSTDTVFNDTKGLVEATWAAGTDRFSILYDILYSTKEAQTLIVNGKKDGEIKPGSKPPGGISYLPELDVGVELLDYNSETHTYNKNITYYIQERQSTQVFSTPKELEEASDSPEALKEKLKFVRRRYDYFGTGKNTEIVEFNIKIQKDLLLNLPAYNAQKRVAVADNPGTGTTEIQTKQVASSDKATNTEGVKPPTPVDPDKTLTKKKSLSSGVKTSPEKTVDVNASVNQTSVALSSSNTQNSLSQITNGSLDVNSSQFQTQFAEILNKSKPLDSITYEINVSNTLTSNQLVGGTRDYGATAEFVNRAAETPTTITDGVSSGRKTFLEDMERNRSDSPRSDVTFRRSAVSTPINNSGGYNLDDSSTLGKSFVTALLGQVYGGFGDMNSVSMEVRGDPLWLGVTNKAHTDQMGSLVIKDSNSNVAPPSDHKLLLVVVFPTKYDENTGLAIPNKVSEGYTALYNLRTVTSNFQGGKFTQTLELYQDLCTEQVRKYIDPKSNANL